MNERNPMSSTYPPVTLPNTQVRLLTSSIVNDTYRLHISLPITYMLYSKYMVIESEPRGTAKETSVIDS
jgi:hypothetical protein